MSGRIASHLVLGSVLFTLSLATSAAAQNRTVESFQLALGLINRGIYDDAARQLERFVKAQPGHEKAGEANYRLGVCYLEMKKPDDAIVAFRRALRSRDLELKAECRYRLAHTMAQKGDHAGASKQFAKLLEEAGDRHYLAAASSFAMGESLRQAGDDEAALAAYTKAARLDGEKDGRFAVTALYQAGFIELKREKYEAAGKLFGQAADRFPEHEASGECRFLQGEAALRGGKFGAARRAFDAAERAGGAFADDAAMGLGHCLARNGKPQEAVEQFRRVVRDHGKSPLVGKAMLEAGRLLYESKQYEPAEQQLSELLQQRELQAQDRWAALELRGLARLDLGRSEPAVADLRDALKLAEAPADAARMWYSLGEAYADDGKWKEALAAYGECQAKSQDDVQRGEALYGQCLALHRLTRYRESNELAREFLKKFGDHALAVTARFAVAENHFALKDYAAADKIYEQVPADHQLRAKASFKSAWCSYLAGDHKTAASRFAQIAGQRKKDEPEIAEEALSMQALAALEGGALVPALDAADRYKEAYPQGKFLARTERVAARVLKRQGKLKLAASRLSRAASVETSKDRASGDQLEFAEVLFKQGDFAAASKAYEKLAGRKDEVGGRAHEGMAWCAFELGEDDACVQWIDRGLKHAALGNGRAGLLELKSALYHRQKAWGPAEAVASKFVEEFGDHPRAAEVRYAMGVAQARAGKLKEARATFTALQGVEMERRDRVFYELAWACRRDDDEQAALVAFGQAAALSKDEDLGGECRLHLGEALLKKKQEVEGSLRMLAEVRGKYFGRAQYLCGFTRLEQEKFSVARDHFDRIVALGADHPLYQEAQFFAGETFFRQKNYKDAATRYAVVLDKAPDHPRAQLARLHQGLSLVELRQAQPAVAVLGEYLRRAGDKDKGDRARANLWMGRAWQLAGDHDRAERAFASVTDLTDSELSAEAQYRIGECRHAAGKTDTAVEAFVKLSVLYGHAEWVQKGLNAAGDCYLKLEKPAKAKKMFEELVQRYPESALAKSARQKLDNLRSMQP